MIAANCEHATLFHRAVNIENVVGRAATDIDDESAQTFLMRSEHYLRGSERGENDILYFERQLFHAADRVLDSRPHPVNNMKIRFELFPEHPDRTQHAILAVDVIMLNDRVQKCVLRRNAHLAGVDLYVLDILLIDFVAILRQQTEPRLLKL